MSEALQIPTACFEPIWFSDTNNNTSFVADLRFSSTATGAAAYPDVAPVEPAPAEDERLAAFEEGLRQGRAEALADAKQENAERRKLGAALRRLDEEMIDRLGQQLSETVAVLCEATLAPLALDQAQLIERCRRAAVLLGETMDACTLYLNPGDIPKLDAELTANWHVAADEALEPGSLRLAGREGEIADGPQEWRRSLAETLGLQ